MGYLNLIPAWIALHYLGGGFWSVEEPLYKILQQGEILGSSRNLEATWIDPSPDSVRQRSQTNLLRDS